ncbi:DUF1489 family protein [Rhodoblastus sp.]|uniref:DUF1489 family protein n=1 Tax=Rhodoblastus sp. TaxID=1962975 RepID=UPI0035AF0687
MTLHLLKLCVGVDTISELRAFTRMRRAHAPEVHAHVTRMIPKRADELLDGGSLYWVIKGQTCARQKLVGIEPFVDSAGIKRCALQLDDEVIAVRPQPHRAFQGWRYLEPKEAPPDLDVSGAGLADMPEALRRELSDLGLI